MQRVKYIIPVIILFVTIGFATVNQTLSLKGEAKVKSDLDDFNVYFSNVLVDGEKDLSLVESETQLTFTTTLNELGSQYAITYDITNASKYFDANFTVTCTNSNDHLSITNEIDTSTLSALATRTGNITLKKTQTNSAAEAVKYTVTCNIVATAVEKESEATGTPNDPVTPLIYFYIDGTRLYAKPNMTWLEWIDSEYNTFGEFYTEEGIDVYYDPSGASIRVYYGDASSNQETYVLGEHTIIEGTEYSVISLGGIENVGDE